MGEEGLDGAAARIAGLLLRLGWREWIDAPTGSDLFTGGGPGLIKERFLAAVRTINPGPDGRPWLDQVRLDYVWDTVTRRLALDLVVGNSEFLDLLHGGVVVDGLAGWGGGRSRSVRLVDWDDPGTNGLLVVTDLSLDRPRDGGAPEVVLDVVLFVNGIPFCVLACAKSGHSDGVSGAIDALRALTGQRPFIPDTAVPDLFRYVQVLGATDGSAAVLGTVTSLPEHYATWRTTAPFAESDVQAALEVAGPLTALHRLVAGVLRPGLLLDITRNFSVFQQSGTQTIRLVVRHQQFRAVLMVVRRLLLPGASPRDRGGLIWHTQGSGKSLTMAFLIRKMRTTRALRAFKVVVVSDRVDLKRQLTPALSLSGERPRIAEDSATARAYLGDDVPGVVQLMIQQSMRDGLRGQAEVVRLAGDPEGDVFDAPVLNPSDKILLLIDEAHRTQSGKLHAALSAAVPNAVKIGLTGTPVIKVRKQTTSDIFGSLIDDPYTLRESVADGATVPIRYEGRHVAAMLERRDDLDAAYTALAGGAEGVPGLPEVLGARDLIKEKARDILVHWVSTILPSGFKGQIVAVSRAAAVRYRGALDEARGELVAAAQAYRARPGSHGGFDAEVLAMAERFLPLLRLIDFVPVISAGAEGLDPGEWRRWTGKDAQLRHIERFQDPFPEIDRLPWGRTGSSDGEPWHGLPGRRRYRADPGGNDPWSEVTHDDAFSFRTPVQTDRPPIAFLIVQRMLLTGFDAPLEQALYIDRPIREAELLQAIARTNRPARKKTYGLVVDYVALTENLGRALADYDLDDLEGMREGLIEHELPELEARAADLLAFLDELGVGVLDTEPDRDRMLELLEDRGTRARFDVAAAAFFSHLERLLPRPQTVRFQALAKSVGFTQWLTRRHFRDTAIGRPDPYRYGALLRDLLDDHIRASQALQQVPPVEITDAGFAEAVDALRGDRIRAREYEYALRHHIDNHRVTDPIRYGRVSEQLEEILRRMDGAWAELARELRDLVDVTLAGDAQVNALGLEPLTEAPIFSILEQRLAQELRHALEQGALVAMTRDIAELVRVEVTPPHFPDSGYLQENLRRDLRRRLVELSGISRRAAGPIAEEIMGVVRSNRDTFLA